MPTERHLWNLQYWHLFRFFFWILQFRSHLSYSSFSLMVLLKKPWCDRQNKKTLSLSFLSGRRSTTLHKQKMHNISIFSYQISFVLCKHILHHLCTNSVFVLYTLFPCMLAHVSLYCSSLFPTLQERFKEIWLKTCIVLHVQSTLIRTY